MKLIFLLLICDSFASFIRGNGSDNVEEAMKPILKDGESKRKSSDIQTALSSALNKGTEDIVDYKRGRDLIKSAYLEISKKMRSLFLTSGCIRDYSKDCPIGWKLSSNVCEAPSDSICGSLNLSGASEDEKQAIAFTCEAEWPCKYNSNHINTDSLSFVTIKENEKHNLHSQDFSSVVNVIVEE